VKDDPYDILGIGRSASQEDIRRAYRRLARKLHPDLNPGDRAAEERFKRLSAAYDLLGDPEKRERFDRGEIDASGEARPQPPPRHHHDAFDMTGDGPYPPGTGPAGMMDMDDLLGSVFGHRSGTASGTSRFRIRGGDLRGRLTLDFLEAVNGTTKRVTLPDGRTVDVTVPPGTQDGQVLRLRGRGGPGIGGAQAGDLLLEVEVGEHRYFTRLGDDIHLELPISLSEAVLGGRAEAPTPTGPVAVSIPKGSNTGTVLRLRGRGVPRPDGSRGDAYITLKVVLPNGRDPELEAFAAGWAAGKAHNPRLGMES
jgi:DnaJ-class molecular chaperone